MVTTLKICSSQSAFTTNQTEAQIQIDFIFQVTMTKWQNTLSFIYFFIQI